MSWKEWTCKMAEVDIRYPLSAPEMKDQLQPAEMLATDSHGFLAPRLESVLSPWSFRFPAQKPTEGIIYDKRPQVSPCLTCHPDVATGFEHRQSWQTCRGPNVTSGKIIFFSFLVAPTVSSMIVLWGIFPYLVQRSWFLGNFSFWL